MKILNLLKQPKNCLILALITIILLQTTAMYNMLGVYDKMDRANDKLYIVAMRCLYELGLERSAR
jgi:hypothetical protein